MFTSILFETSQSFNLREWVDCSTTSFTWRGYSALALRWSLPNVNTSNDSDYRSRVRGLGIIIVTAICDFINLFGCITDSHGLKHKENDMEDAVAHPRQIPSIFCAILLQLRELNANVMFSHVVCYHICGLLLGVCNCLFQRRSFHFACIFSR